MPVQTLRILLFNVGYCTEIDGSLKSYLKSSYRYLYNPKKITTNAYAGLHNLIAEQNPDLCFFAEVRPNVQKMTQSASYSFSMVDNKYGRHSILSVLPFFRKNCNGVLSKTAITHRKRYFKNGTKKLIYELTLEDGTVLLFAHFSLMAHTRKKQFKELEDIIGNRKNVVLCGDFNTLSHPDELLKFAKRAGLRIVNPKWEATYPTAHPKKDLDLFLCSRTIRLRTIHVLHDVRLSDHLPVVLEMKIGTEPVRVRRSQSPRTLRPFRNSKKGV